MAGDDDVQDGQHALSDDDEYAHDTFHQELVLLYLLRLGVFRDELEKVLQEVLGKRCDVFVWYDGLPLLVDEVQSAIYCNSSICIDHKVR